MKYILVVAGAACTLLVACSRKEDTNARGGWVRTMEPRLSVVSQWQPCRRIAAPGRVVDDASCGHNAPPPQDNAACAEILTHEQALRVLVGRPACLDTVISALERFARTDARAMNDLGAAYYIRAQRLDHPADLLNALEHVDRALDNAPKLATARFNQALTLEALGLSKDAMTAWDEIRKLEHSQWSAEAEQHLERLKQAIAADATTVWPSNEANIAEALRTHNRAALDRLIAPFPTSAERYFEQTLLPKWAATTTPENYDAVQLFASEASRLTGDPFARDVAATLREDAILAYQQAKVADQSYDKGAAAAYQKATQLLQAAGSPLSLRSRLDAATLTAFNAPREAFPLLDPLEKEATARGYAHFAARVQATRAYYLLVESRDLEALAEHGKAIASFERLHDAESAADTRVPIAGLYRRLGQYDLACSAAVQSALEVPRISVLRRRHAILGEAAATATALGHPRIGLLYQQAAVAEIQQKIARTPPEQTAAFPQLHANLAIALRARAGIELALERTTDAERDISEAFRLNPDKIDGDIRNAVAGGIAEVQGQYQLRMGDPMAAIGAFTRALTLTQQNPDLRTFRAGVLAQRSEAERAARRDHDAEEDLTRALEELRVEETRMLAGRRRGAGEEIWKGYFSRFQDAYRQLIRQLVRKNAQEKAFLYAEKARAFEPLNLLLQTNAVPAEFRGLTRGEPLELREIQKRLPRGTYLLEYCILGDSTMAWVISHDDFRAIPLAVGKSDIDRWTSTLQRAAQTHNASDLQTVLLASYVKLFAEPLAVAERSHNGPEPLRLVFIPDGAMHGMPFAALRNPDGNHYLIDDAVVSSAGSATLYVFSLLRDEALRTSPQPTVLLIGNPAFNADLPFATGLKPLEGALREAQAIRDIYAPRANLLTGADATTPHFLDKARTSDVIHIAAHGIANAQEPSRSLLLFAPSIGDSGALDAESLVQRLQAERARLVVLAACSSAGGAPVGPEGVAPLVRPLIGAGVPAVIGTLWDVNDATTASLLVSFHRRYRQGSDAAVALQGAQRELLHKDITDMTSVLAWAPFQVIGYASSPFATRGIEGEPP